MIFTASHLLAASSALLIPLLIHLLNRSRHRKIPWGAMHLLQRVVRTNQRRLRIQQLILLVLRCALPIVLAVALAGPVLTGFQFLSGDAPGCTVILIDNSYSMSATSTESARETVFKDASEALNHILQSQAEATEIALVTVGSEPTTVQPPVLDRRKIRQRFDADVHPNADPADTLGGFAMARDILQRSSRPKKTLIVISDFQTNDWQQGLESIDLPEQATVAFYQVGGPISGNVAVESVDLPQVALAAGQQIEIKATVRNYGDSQAEVPVFLRVNGDRVAASKMDLPARSVSEVEFQKSFEIRGSHLVQIEVDVVDPLSLDNRRAAAIEVPERLPVLVVDPAADAEVNYLKAALTPFELDGIGVEDLIRATFVVPDEFAPSELFGKRAVILTEVNKLTGSQRTALDQFVRDGGGLVIFPGDGSNLTWFNDELFPMLAPSVRWQHIQPTPETATKIRRVQSDHPVFQIFNETDNGDPSSASIASWLDLEVNESAQILSRFADHPFIIESTVHRGRVLISATDARNQWSDMASHAFYVPLMQRLVVYAATNTVPPRNVSVGQPLVALLHPKTAGESLELTDSAGHTHSVIAETQGGVAKAVFPRSTRPGPWTLSNPHGSSPVRFAVQSNREESNLKFLSNAELKTVASEIGATVVRSRADIESFERATRFGTEIWRPLLWLAVVLLFADVYLAQRFVRASAQS